MCRECFVETYNILIGPCPPLNSYLQLTWCLHKAHEFAGIVDSSFMQKLRTFFCSPVALSALPPDITSQASHQAIVAGLTHTNNCIPDDGGALPPANTHTSIQENVPVLVIKQECADLPGIYDDPAA